jgi:hypothetical protein
LQHLLRQNADDIAHSIVLEQGKTPAGMFVSIPTCRSSDVLSDAHGDLLRGLQVVETTAAITTTLIGEKLQGKLPLAIPCLGLTSLFFNSQQRYGHLCQEGSPRGLRKYRTLQLSSVCRIKRGVHF